ncbi:hypothetical protein MHBO_005052, partial [Bonamia ostreae]
EPLLETGKKVTDYDNAEKIENDIREHDASENAEKIEKDIREHELEFEEKVKDAIRVLELEFQQQTEKAIIELELEFEKKDNDIRQHDALENAEKTQNDIRNRK